MSRPLRIDYPGAWHHVMNRSRQGNNLYNDKDDYECFLSLLKETADMFHMNVAAYCLMPNHVHLLVQTEEGNLSRCMRHLNGVYTQKYNVRNKTDGTLCRGRYKSILIQADSYLLQLVRYIHRNPVKAELVKKPGDYQWSSHNGYISSKQEWAWLYRGFILSMISNDQKMQSDQYLRFMELPVSEELELFYSKKNLSTILGDDDFTSWIKETFFQKKSDQEVPESKRLAPAIDIINKAVAKDYRIEADLLFIARRGAENEPRNVAIYLARQIRGESLKFIGKAFNLRRDSSVSSVLERVRIKLGRDKSFRKKVEGLKEKLINKGQT